MLWCTAAIVLLWGQKCMGGRDGSQHLCPNQTQKYTKETMKTRPTQTPTGIRGWKTHQEVENREPPPPPPDNPPRTPCMIRRTPRIRTRSEPKNSCYQHNPPKDRELESNTDPNTPHYTTHGGQRALSAFWGSNVDQLRPLPPPP